MFMAHFLLVGNLAAELKPLTIPFFSHKSLWTFNFFHVPLRLVFYNITPMRPTLSDQGINTPGPFWLSSIPLYMCHVFSVHLSVDGH